MTMEDDGDGECLALSLYVFIYGTVSYLFGLKNASSCFFFFSQPSWKQRVRTYGLMNPLKCPPDALRINILRKVCSPKLLCL